MEEINKVSIRKSNQSWFVQNDKQETSSRFTLEFDTDLFNYWEILSSSYPNASEKYISFTLFAQYDDIVNGIQDFFKDNVKCHFKMYNSTMECIDERDIWFDTLAFTPLLSYENLFDCGDWCVIGKITSQANYPIQSKETSDK